MLSNKHIIRFSFIGIFCAILVSMFYYRYFMIEHVIFQNHQNNNIELAKIYKTTIWDKYPEQTAKLHHNNFQNLLSDSNFVDFLKETVDFFNNVKIAKVNFYNPQGSAFLSNNSFEIIDLAYINSGISYGSGMMKLDHYFLKDIVAENGLERALWGATYSKLISHGQIIKDEIKDYGNFVTTFVPLINNQGNKFEINGVIEIISDASNSWKQINTLEQRTIWIFLVLFMVFFAIILYNTHNAQQIIDKQVENNRLLEEAKTRAEAESSEKSEFLANISHELRTPLNGIIGFSEIIQSEAYGPIDNKQYKEYIVDINNSGKHLLAVINDILDFSKASADKLKVDIMDIDLNKIISSSIRFVQPRADSAKVKLVENMPTEHVIIQADPKRLKQALLNLLSNAVKFTPEKGSVKISLKPNSSAKTIDIIVQDTGIGIAEKDIPKALSIFGQVDNKHSRKYEGTGLGLPLTKKLTELMGGKFEIQSKLGQGTKVILTFAMEDSPIEF